MKQTNLSEDVHIYVHAQLIITSLILFPIYMPKYD